MTIRYTVAYEQEAQDKHSLRFVADDDQGFATDIWPEAIQGELNDFLAKIELLIIAARQPAQQRGDLDIREHGQRLRSQIFMDGSMHARAPAERYISLCARAPFERSTLLDVDGFSASIPWELVWDGYTACLHSSPCWAMPLTPMTRQVKCDHDRRIEEGPLGLIRRLGLRHRHWKAAQYAPSQAPAPTRAYIIADPMEDLKEATHLELLATMLNDCGYQTRDSFRAGSQATSESLFEALGDPACGAIYLFTHCEPAAGRKPPRIRLRDGELSHHRLRDRIKGHPFIFLNGCWSAETKWSQSVGAADSLAGTLLEEGASAVVGALCPIINHQASRAAMLFFAEALRAATFGHALSRVRMESYQRYDRGAADLSWFAYRLYGDPDCCLATGVWNADGSLREDAFDFNAKWLEYCIENIRQQRGGKWNSVGDILSSIVQAVAPGSPDLRSGAARRSVIDSLKDLAHNFPPPIIQIPWSERRDQAATDSFARETEEQTIPPSQEELLPGTPKEEIGREMRGPAAAGAQPASDPLPILPRSDFRARQLFGNLLQIKVRRAQLMHALGAKPAEVEWLFRLNLADFLDAYNLGHTLSSPAQAAENLERMAREKVNQLLFALETLEKEMTPGAGMVIHQALRIRRLGGANLSHHRAVLMALLEYPLIGSQQVLPGQEAAIAVIRRQLEELPGGPPPETEDFDQFIAVLLARAKLIPNRDPEPSRERQIDERKLYLALCELAEWVAADWPAYEPRAEELAEERAGSVRK